MAPGPHDGYRRIRPGFSRRARTQSTPLNDGPTNSCVAYAKGAWVLAMLERVVGRTALEHGMRGVRCGSAGQNGVQDFLPGFGAATATAERFLKPWVEKPGCSGNSCRPAIGKAASVTTGIGVLAPAVLATAGDGGRHDAVEDRRYHRGRDGSPCGRACGASASRSLAVLSSLQLPSGRTGFDQGKHSEKTKLSAGKSWRLPVTCRQP